MIFVFFFLVLVFLLDLCKSFIIKDKINNNLILLNKFWNEVDYEFKKVSEIIIYIFIYDKLILVGNLWDFRKDFLDLWEYFEYYKCFESLNWINGKFKFIMILFICKGEIIYFIFEEFGFFFIFGFKNFYNYFLFYKMDFNVWYNKVFKKSNDKFRKKFDLYEF